MNGRSDMDGDAAHRATRDALPWLLSGRLGGDELDAAQAHLAGCAACRADFQQLRRLREAAAAPDPQCDPDAALGRLLARIDAPVQPPADVSPPPTLRGRAANDPRWLRRMALAQCGVIVLLAVLLARPGPPADSFRGLGAAPAATGQAVVVFRPETAERELRRILRASGARVVGGPTVTDAWLLAMPQADAAASLARLRAEPAVLLAEPLGATGHP
ncbi:zf-HC2 domain-containing protein [Massilia litorea]|uniref:Zf-HC2 domain-containing protein n=1 Tax=Massilia litorea TaxID=2769491 RepID=A0A7L9TZR1_9BURK|nr:zf-HC2 domain-containing protein [Massilia litorea]QOL48271.1 zf-HC2 domain-containing protein [Massilia litorea]